VSKYTKIKAELDGNAAIYSGMTDAEVVAELNAVDKTRVRQNIAGSELFGYTDFTEYSALSDTQKQQWLGLCAIDSVSKDAVPIIKSLFLNGSVTWGAIVKTETVSRVEELGLGRVAENDITISRTQ